MRTLLFVAAGIALWVLITVIARLRQKPQQSGYRLAIAFAVIWLAPVTWNLWVGVTQAGYSVAEELPIFLVIYIVPLAVARMTIRKRNSR